MTIFSKPKKPNFTLDELLDHFIEIIPDHPPKNPSSVENMGQFDRYLTTVQGAIKMIPSTSDEKRCEIIEKIITVFQKMATQLGVEQILEFSHGVTPPQSIAATGSVKLWKAFRETFPRHHIYPSTMECPPFFYALLLEHVDLIKLMLQESPTVTRQRNAHGVSPVQLLANNIVSDMRAGNAKNQGRKKAESPPPNGEHYIEIFKLLTEHDPRILNAFDHKGRTVVTFCVDQNATELFSILVPYLFQTGMTKDSILTLSQAHTIRHVQQSESSDAFLEIIKNRTGIHFTEEAALPSALNAEYHLTSTKSGQFLEEIPTALEDTNSATAKQAMHNHCTEACKLMIESFNAVKPNERARLEKDILFILGRISGRLGPGQHTIFQADNTIPQVIAGAGSETLWDELPKIFIQCVVLIKQMVYPPFFCALAMGHNALIQKMIKSHSICMTQMNSKAMPPLHFLIALMKLQREKKYSRPGLPFDLPPELDYMRLIKLLLDTDPSLVELLDGNANTLVDYAITLGDTSLFELVLLYVFPFPVNHPETYTKFQIEVVRAVLVEGAKKAAPFFASLEQYLGLPLINQIQFVYSLSETHPLAPLSAVAICASLRIWDTLKRLLTDLSAPIHRISNAAGVTQSPLQYAIMGAHCATHHFRNKATKPQKKGNKKSSKATRQSNPSPSTDTEAIAIECIKLLQEKGANVKTPLDDNGLIPWEYATHLGLFKLGEYLYACTYPEIPASKLTSIYNQSKGDFIARDFRVTTPPLKKIKPKQKKKKTNLSPQQHSGNGVKTAATTSNPYSAEITTVTDENGCMHFLRPGEQIQKPWVEDTTTLNVSAATFIPRGLFTLNGTNGGAKSPSLLFTEQPGAEAAYS